MQHREFTAHQRGKQMEKHETPLDVQASKDEKREHTPMSGDSKVSSVLTSQHNILIESLGRHSPDAFYFMCAYSPLSGIQSFPTEHITQQHLDLGLKAAYATERADIAKYLLCRGADAGPLLAFIGLTPLHEFFAKGEHDLRLQHIENIPVDITPSWTSDRQYNDLRLKWVSTRPKSQTVLTAVEGSMPPAPTILHFQAINTSFSPSQRIAWMQFDLDRGTDINSVADIRNVQGTPLHWVLDDHGSVWENREVLVWLVDRGADLSVRNADGRTAREVCEGMLAMEDDCLVGKMREFYRFALDVLEEAGRKRRKNEGGGWLRRVKDAIGLGVS